LIPEGHDCASREQALQAALAYLEAKA